MFKSIAVGILALAIGLLPKTGAFAQMDALVVSFNRCIDPSRPAESRIRACIAVINARGIDQDEVAFAWLDLGMAYKSQGGDRQRELEAYDKAIELQPDLWQAHFNRGALYFEAGDADKALADYLAMRQSGPDKVQYYRTDSHLDYRTAHIEGATSDRSNMDRPGREEADYANALDTLGRALQTALSNRCTRRAFAGLELDAALKDCDAVLQINASDETARHARGIVEFRLARWQAALSEFNAALSNHPNAAASLFMKGIVERRMGEVSGGNTDIAAAEALDGHLQNSYAQFGIQP
ncbi:MAG TPA: tetratricopeptide repeat protein [Rhizomicrobium sp.]|jgi:tetratricopeptide (TPR) repeat protein|nr:tetratricopeptide repeat protein [Rhizomicrobium sp.]